jgi:hypothetical protein
MTGTAKIPEWAIPKKDQKVWFSEDQIQSV